MTESRIEFSGARLNKVSRGQPASFVTLKIVSDFAINISVLPEILQMGQWTWVRACWSTDRKLPNRAPKWRTVVPTSSPGSPEGTVGKHPTCFKYLPVSGTPRVVIENVCGEGTKGETPKYLTKKKTLLCMRWLGWVPYRRSLTGAQLTFQIQYHPLSKRTEESEST